MRFQPRLAKALVWNVSSRYRMRIWGPILLVFSPVKVVFARFGVLPLVSIPLDFSAQGLMTT